MWHFCATFHFLVYTVPASPQLLATPGDRTTNFLS